MEHPSVVFNKVAGRGFQRVSASELKRLATDPIYAFLYAKALGFKNIPVEIEKAIAKNKELAAEVFNVLGKDTPKILKIAMK